MRISKSKKAAKLKDAVKQLSGVDIDACYQCRKCSCGCTVTGIAASPPSEMIRRLQLGADDELLDNDLIWTCVSCDICYARCPMGIDTRAVMDALRTLAVTKGRAPGPGNVPLLDRSFLKTVEIFGRTYDLAMITAYKIGTSSFGQDMDKFPVLLKKRKIALLPSLGGDRKTVKQIFNTIRQNKETSR
ncbi:MAG: 4Fe-4S dicluster domain-containing protein [Pseudomonadota bacterium]